MKKLRYGIIGCGGISGKHLTGYSALADDVEIVACCDIIEERMDNVAKKYNIPKKYRDYKDLLVDPEIDFVSVCLPNCLHNPVTCEALKVGKHVHCEKPMALNTAQAQEMLDTSRKTCKKLMIGLNNRFTPQSQFVKQYIAEGNLGEIYYARCGWVRRAGMAIAGWFTDKEQSGGGPLIDLGVHYIDLVMYFMNYPKVRDVSARTYCKFGANLDLRQTYTGAYTRLDLPYNVEDFAVGFINLENDACISFEISWASNIEREKLFYEILGTNGGIKMETQPGGPFFKIFSRIGDQLVDIEPKLRMDAYQGEFAHFVESIRTGKDPTISVPEQGVEMMTLIDGIYRSADSRQPYFFK